MARSTPRVEGSSLLGPDGEASAIVVSTPAWYAWLENATTFAFTSEQGGFTARKERSGQTGWYWKAYRKYKGTLHRVYLGKSADLSLDRLNAVARNLAQRSLTPPSFETRNVTSPAPDTSEDDAPPLTNSSLPTGTLTFCFSDIEGSTQLWEQHSQTMPVALARHDAILRDVIVAHSGVVFKTVGDSMHAVFVKAADALAAALAAQRALYTETWAISTPLRVRMALHTGAAELRDGDYFGSSLNRTARILALGHGGQILLSRATHDLVADDLPSQTSLRDLGEHALKDLRRPEQIFQLLSPDLPSDFAPLRSPEPRPTSAQPLALLSTKLSVPPPRAQLVPRPRLTARLAAGLRGKLTLIAAPAGFGKTTLVTAWRATPSGDDTPLAWVSLDVGDNDPIRFWSYVIAALEQIERGVGASALGMLQSPQLPPIEAVLTALLNALSIMPADATLVLDDYHMIDTPAIHQAMAFLLDHLPLHLHLLITTRVDPPLPLTRLRARGELAELRAADLRFTVDEVATFLTDLMGLPLSAANVAALETRTEGWIAGLQFAALAMRDRRDISGFITAFTGSNRFVMDYLAEEVFDRLPGHLQTFLLQTSILERLCGSLCDAVLLGDVAAPLPLSEQPSAYSQVLLEKLERANLFLMALDDDHHWYRYHQLFAEVLRQRLSSGAGADAVRTLHGRASAWYEQRGLLNEAVQHAIAARDITRAADLIEQAASALRWRGELATLAQWLQSLPQEVVRARPRLSLAAVAVLVYAAQTDASAARLREAEQLLDAHSALSHPEKESLLSELAALRAQVAMLRDEVPDTHELRQALTRAPESDGRIRGMLMVSLGYAERLHGSLAAASQAYSEASGLAQALGDHVLALQALGALAELWELQGQLRRSAHVHQQAINLAQTHHGPPLPVAGMAHIGLSKILREWNELEHAASHLQEGIALGRQGGLEGLQLDGSITWALVLQAQGDRDGAQAMLRQAAQIAQKWNLDRISVRVATFQARLGLMQGQVQAAAEWAHANQLNVNDDLNEWLEIEYCTLARLLIAQGRLDDALALLDRLRAGAETAGRTGRMIEVLALSAVALHRHGNLVDAFEALDRALSLAAPEGYIRVFVDEGASMAALLARSAERRAHNDPIRAYAERLLSAFPPEQHGETASDSGMPPILRSALERSGVLVEPLTDRELEVLRLMAAGRSNTEIAQSLVVAVSTVKTHVNRIFGKLGAASRTQAVARAHELRLL